MKIRPGLTATVSAAVIGAALVAGAAPAHANQSDEFHITDGSNIYFLWAPAAGDQLYIANGGGGTTWQNVNGTTKSILGSNPEPVYEWQASGTSQCWTYDASNNDVDLQACTSGNTKQLFWQTTSDQFINVYASNAAGTHFCLNATHAENRAPVNAIACKSKSAPGGFDQYWYD